MNHNPEEIQYVQSPCGPTMQVLEENAVQMLLNGTPWCYTVFWDSSGMVLKTGRGKKIKDKNPLPA